MSITTTVHLNFRGEARAALEFYRSVFGGELAAFTNAQAGFSPAVDSPAGDSSVGGSPAGDSSVGGSPAGDQIAWGEVRSGNGFHVMAYDVRAGQAYDAGDRAFFVSVRGTDTDEVTSYWKGLSEGGTVIEDLGPAGWSALYGMVKDRFGVTWVLDVIS